jgi:hypothetical protein
MEEAGLVVPEMAIASIGHSSMIDEGTINQE